MKCNMRSPNRKVSHLAESADSSMFRDLREAADLLMNPPRTREEILERHRVTLEGMEAMPVGATSLGLTTGSTKGLVPPVNLSSCSPISIASMTLESTHSRRYLRCRVITDCALLQSIQTIVEDENGDVTKLCIYNAVDPSHPSAVQTMRAMFPKGRRVIVLEPYFKTFQDNSFGIRADNPQDIIQDEEEALDASSLQQRSNELFKRGEFNEAVSGYSGALTLLGTSTASKSNTMVDLLNNISMTYIRMGDDKASLVFAYAALAIDNHSEKANHRARSCLKNMASPSANSFELLSNTEFHFAAIEAWISVLENSQLEEAAEGGTEGSADAIKQYANTLYRGGHYSEAIVEYRRALQFFKAGSPLLSNRAACHLKLMTFTSALQDAVAAHTVDNSNSKAIYRASVSLMELEGHGSHDSAINLASTVTQYGLSHCADAKTSFQDLHNRITIAQKAYPPVEAPASLNDGGIHVDEKSFHAMASSSHSTLDSVRGFNQLLEMGEQSGKAIPGLRLEKRVPPYHIEFKQHAVKPRCIDADRCFKVLELSYEQSRGICLHELELIHSHPKLNESQKSQYKNTMLLKRLGEWSEETLGWFMTAPFGDVRQVQRRRPYDRTIFHSFTNEWNRPEYYYSDSTHVAIGFVDLGSLREGIFADEIVNFKWVGYEASHYAAAKSLVLAQMLLSKCPVDDIIQVWYSTCWSLSAESSFKRAVSSLIEGKSSPSVELHSSPALHSPQVAALLRHWLLHSVPLEKARSAWLEHPISNDEIANLMKKDDRLALASFILTGQLLEADVGSITMFSLPVTERIHRALEEFFIYSIDEVSVFKKRKETPDIISAALACLRSSISRLRTLISSQNVYVVIHHQSLSPKDHVLLHSIASLNPSSISWSNVCDYFSHCDFHSMAKECSTPNTIHFAYSMNWPIFVKGASVLDHENADDKITMKKLIIEARLVIHEYNRLLGAEDLFLDPPVTNARNLVDFLLQWHFHKMWVNAFFGCVDPCRVLLVEKKGWQYFSRVNSTIFLTFTYNPDIEISGSSNIH